MSVRPTKHRKIFTLYEDSFHDFKGWYFKIFAVGNHRPFWLSLEGDGLFPPYWSDQAGFDIAPVKYEGLNADKRDTADILTFLFSNNNLSSKSLLNSPEESRKAIAKMAGNNTMLARLRRLVRSAPAKSLPSSSAVPASGAQSVPTESAGKALVEPDGGSSTDVGKIGVGEQVVEVSSPAGEEISLPPPPSPKRSRSAVEGAGGSKRARTSEGGSRDFCPMDRSFDASGFVESHLLGPRAQEILRDCDPLESIRWAEWAMISAATVLKSMETRLTIADEAERLNAKLLGDAKTLNLQKMAKGRGGSEGSEGRDGDLGKEKAAEIERLRHREEVLLAEVEKFRGSATEEKVRADLAAASVADLQKQCEDLAEDAKGAVAATEGALKAQLAILLPDFDTDQISFFKDIVDGKTSVKLIPSCRAFSGVLFARIHSSSRLNVLRALIRRRVIFYSLGSSCDLEVLCLPLVNAVSREKKTIFETKGLIKIFRPPGSPLPKSVVTRYGPSQLGLTFLLPGLEDRCCSVGGLGRRPQNTSSIRFLSAVASSKPRSNRGLGSPISTGMMASIPYVSRNGVSPVED
ncbi:hypothetical protein PIB30_084289 [Stylosanthes scabra]|uniref:Uncharacterized protein n=1 Tax=Stylosanthes scabra TaxID=79078 RepID=A0ABU6VRB8_9FABA|nr:hypothetical protein [Stylosanthes scabra]